MNHASCHSYISTKKFATSDVPATTNQASKHLVIVLAVWTVFPLVVTQPLYDLGISWQSSYTNRWIFLMMGSLPSYEASTFGYRSYGVDVGGDHALVYPYKPLLHSPCFILSYDMAHRCNPTTRDEYCIGCKGLTFDAEKEEDERSIIFVAWPTLAVKFPCNRWGLAGEAACAAQNGSSSQRSAMAQRRSPALV